MTPIVHPRPDRPRLRPSPARLASLLIAVFALLAATLPPLAASELDVTAVVAKLEPEIERAMIEGHIPSCTVALVDDQKILWVGAYGHSNLWARVPAVPSTVYLIGSTFKTMSAAALLQLWEQKKFGLDDPVRDHADYAIRDEDPAQRVTFRHLLTHTSGLPQAFGGHAVWGDSVPAPISEYLAESLRVVGPPLERVRYSNMAYTLIAHLVEMMSGVPYREYMRREIFEPLEMHDTVFEVSPQIEERLAIPYELDDGGRPRPATRLKADVWPAGIVYGTVGDQARWLIAMLAGGTYQDHRILQQETVEMAIERQYEEFGGPMTAGWGNESAGYGLTWWTARKGGDRHFAHSGSVPGYTAFLEGNYDRKLGFALLSNGHRAHPQWVRLADRALAWLKEAQAEAEAGPSATDPTAGARGRAVRPPAPSRR